MKGSVWSSLPPIKTSSDQGKPIILTVASMDSASFFRDKSLGADSPISVGFKSFMPPFMLKIDFSIIIFLWNDFRA